MLVQIFDLLFCVWAGILFLEFWLGWFPVLFRYIGFVITVVWCGLLFDGFPSCCGRNINLLGLHVGPSMAQRVLSCIGLELVVMGVVVIIGNTATMAQVGRTWADTILCQVKAKESSFFSGKIFFCLQAWALIP